MALQSHMTGGASLQNVCHIRRCTSFPSTATGAAIPRSFAMAFPSRSSLHVANHSPEKLQQHCRPLRCAAAASSKEMIAVDKGSDCEENQPEFPPLLASVMVPGLPPCQGSMFADEALKYLVTVGPVDMYEPYYHMGVSFISFAHCGAVSAKHLAPIAGTCIFMTILDDILIDNQDPGCLTSLGIDEAVLDSPETIFEYMCTVKKLFLQEDRPESLTALEDLVWTTGRDLRELTPNPASFHRFADAFFDFLTANYEVYRDQSVGKLPLPGLASYTETRLRTAAYQMSLASVPFCLDSYLPAEVLEHPVVERLSMLTVTYASYIQDIFSFSRDLAEGTTNNVISVIMASEPGMTLSQAAWKAVNIAKGLAEEFLELEATLQLPASLEDHEHDVRLYLEALKEVMSGWAYWHSKSARYRHPDSPFPEMRDENVSSLPYADSVKVLRK